MSAEKKEEVAVFNQSTAVTRCRGIKESKLKAQYALAKLADEEVTIHSANLDEGRNQLMTQLFEQRAFDKRQIAEAEDFTDSRDRKNQFITLVDKLSALKLYLRFQEDNRETDTSFKLSVRHKRAALQVQLARLEKLQKAERNELFAAQARLSMTSARIRDIEVGNMKDAKSARALKKKYAIMDQQTQIRQQKENQFLRELQLCKTRQLVQLTEMDITNSEEMQELIAQHKAAEFELIAQHKIIEGKNEAALERQMAEIQSRHLIERQKIVKIQLQRAQKRQSAELEKTQKRAQQMREKTLFAENPIIMGVSMAQSGMLSNENGLITISGEIQTLGQILEVNNKALTIFGYKKHEMMGGNVNMIVPSPFAEIHHQVLRRYLATGHNKVIDKTREVLGINSEGYLFPVSLHVKHIVDPEGKICFIGIAKEVAAVVGLGYLIMDKFLNVKHYSKSISTLLGKRIPKGAPLASWISCCTSDKAAQIGSPQGYTVQLVINDKKWDIKLRGEMIVLGSLESFICTFTFKENNGESVTNTDAETGATEEAMPMVFSAHGSKDNLSGDQGAMPMVFSAHGSKDNLGGGEEAAGGDAASSSRDYSNGDSSMMDSEFEETEATEEGGDEAKKNSQQNKTAGGRNMTEEEKELQALVEAGRERNQNAANHHKNLLKELRSQHKQQLAMRIRDQKRKVSELLKENMEEIETMKNEQEQTMNELINSSKAEDVSDTNAVDNTINIKWLPDHIKADITSGHTPSAVKFEFCTLASIEIVNYDVLVASLSPEAVVAMVHAADEKLSAHVAKFPQLFKVNFDAGVAIIASGLDKDHAVGSSHVPAMAEVVLAFVEAIKADLAEMKIPGTEKSVDIKVGIHAGPVIGGLVGTHFPRYQLIGEGVSNVRALTSTSEPGAVQVSSLIVRALGENEEFQFEERGQIDDNGVKINAFWLN